MANQICKPVGTGSGTGFILVESLIALAVGAFLVGVIATYQATAAAQLADTRLRLLALNQAIHELERLSFAPHADKQMAEGIIALSCSYESVKQLSCDYPIDQFFATSLQIVKVRASWRSASGTPCSLTLVGCVPQEHVA